MNLFHRISFQIADRRKKVVKNVFSSFIFHFFNGFHFFHIFFFASKPLVLCKYTWLESLNHDLALLFIRVPVILKVSIELGSCRNLNNTFDYDLQSVYVKRDYNIPYLRSNIMKQCNISVLVWFTTSKAGIYYQYNKFCTQVALRVTEQLKTYEIMKNYKNLKPGWRKSLVHSIPSKNENLVIAVKHYRINRYQRFLASPSKGK